MTARPGALARELVAFTLVGLVGLGIDAGAFVLLTQNAGWSIALARPVALSGSIAVTWALNRVITFAAHRSPRRGDELLRYAAVQACGLAVNLAVFSLCVWLAPRESRTPLVPLMIGCAAGFAFNFVVLRLVVFRRGARAAPLPAEGP